MEVSRLKLMKADHQSKQYRLEDQLLKYFPQEIETNKGYIQGFEADLETLDVYKRQALASSFKVMFKGPLPAFTSSDL